MAFALTIKDAKGRRQHIADGGELVVGGDSDCDLPLNDPTVSRRHARVLLDPKTPEVEDLGSTNGSWLNDSRLRPGERAQWRQGETLKLGDTLVQWQPIDDDDASPQIKMAEAAPLESSRPPAEATLPTGRFEHFYRTALPHLLETAADASLLTMGRAVGEALAAATEAGAARVDDLRESPPASLFALGDLPDDALAAEKDGLRISLALPGSDGSDAQPLVRCALALLGLARPALDSQQPIAVAGPNPGSLEPAMKSLHEQAARAASAGLNVVIVGATGTGKEVLARHIHRHSPAAEKSWTAINCASLPESLLEAELLGIEKGVATGVDSRAGVFEQANGGLLFLDEVADMSLATQARILRVLEEQVVRRVGGTQPRAARVQIVAASNRDLEDLVRKGEFRRDLFHRLADWRAQIPDLQDRPRDIPNLASHFLAEAAGKVGRSLRGLSAGALRALSTYDWPGNVREMQREMHRVAAFAADNAVITAADLADHIRGERAGRDSTLENLLLNAERRILRRVLAECDGGINQAAETLGVSRATLYRRLKATGIRGQSQE